MRKLENFPKGKRDGLSRFINKYLLHYWTFVQRVHFKTFQSVFSETNKIIMKCKGASISIRGEDFSVMLDFQLTLQPPHLHIKISNDMTPFAILH